MLKAPCLSLPCQRQANPNCPSWDSCKIYLWRCAHVPGLALWQVLLMLKAGAGQLAKGKPPCCVWLCLKACGNSFEQFLVDARADTCRAELGGYSAVEPEPSCARCSCASLALHFSCCSIPCLVRGVLLLLPRWSVLTSGKMGPSEHPAILMCCCLSQCTELLALAQMGIRICLGGVKRAHSLLLPYCWIYR